MPLDSLGVPLDGLTPNATLYTRPRPFASDLSRQGTVLEVTEQARQYSVTAQLWADSDTRVDPFALGDTDGYSAKWQANRAFNAAQDFADRVEAAKTILAQATAAVDASTAAASAATDSATAAAGSAAAAAATVASITALTTAAQTAAGTAAASASAAATSATAAGTSATNAGTSATTAASSMTAAGTSATNAATSAASAAASSVAAALYRDQAQDAADHVTTLDVTGTAPSLGLSFPSHWKAARVTVSGFTCDTDGAYLTLRLRVPSVGTTLNSSTDYSYISSSQVPGSVPPTGAHTAGVNCWQLTLPLSAGTAAGMVEFVVVLGDVGINPSIISNSENYAGGVQRFEIGGHYLAATERASGVRLLPNVGNLTKMHVGFSRAS